ncbi:MAG: flagellar filament outer layer protein FlaA [Treponemataceae bacterium]
MKKNIIFIALLCFTLSVFYAQEEGAPATASLTTPDAAAIGADTARQSLKEVSIDLFEREAAWSVSIASDDGVATSRLFDGMPAAKEELPDSVPEGQVDLKSLGVRIDFFRRGQNPIYIKSVRPLPIEGIAKTVSVWVAGRNFNHRLKLLVQDSMGKTFELSLGRLNFSGWKKLTATIPASADGKTGIIQSNLHYPSRNGLRILGFRIDCDPDDAYGTYYIYFDDMRAVTDLYAFESRDPDDMIDNW